MIGAIAEATDLPFTTGVTCPTVRIHPAVIAQAAATSAVMLGPEQDAFFTTWAKEILPRFSSGR